MRPEALRIRVVRAISSSVNGSRGCCVFCICLLLISKDTSGLYRDLLIFPSDNVPQFLKACWIGTAQNLRVDQPDNEPEYRKDGENIQWEGRWGKSKAGESSADW